MSQVDTRRENEKFPSKIEEAITQRRTVAVVDVSAKELFVAAS